MATTTHGLPYPIASDAPAGHTQMQSLATAVDAALTYGRSIIATNETIPTAGGFAVATTPDRVSGVVVPTNGFLRIRFSALTKVAASGAVAAIFIGANQLTSMSDAGAPVAQQVAIPASGTPSYGWIYTNADGLTFTTAANGDSTVVTTGMIRGSDVIVDVAAGTYTVEIQYDASGFSGTLDVKERKLYVQAGW